MVHVLVVCVRLSLYVDFRKSLKESSYTFIRISLLKATANILKFSTGEEIDDETVEINAETH